MTKAKALCSCLLCACMNAAQHNPAPAIACHPKAIGAAERVHYNDLMKRLRAAVRNRSELTNGYAYELGNAITLPEVAEWMSLERLCCPFLTFRLSAAGNESGWLLSLTGPSGVKSLLQTEFPAD